MCKSLCLHWENSFSYDSFVTNVCSLLYLLKKGNGKFLFANIQEQLMSFETLLVLKKLSNLYNIVLAFLLAQMLMHLCSIRKLLSVIIFYSKYSSRSFFFNLSRSVVLNLF